MIEIAKYLDKKSLLQFRATGSAIANKLPLDMFFETSIYSADYWFDFERLKRLCQTQEASKVKNLQWIGKRTYSFNIPHVNNLPSWEEVDSVRWGFDPRGWLILMSPLCFENLKSLDFILDYDLSDIIDRPASRFEDTNPLDTAISNFRKILAISCHNKPLKIHIGLEYLLLCTISWTGNFDDTGNISLENIRDYLFSGDEFNRMPYEDLDEDSDVKLLSRDCVGHERVLVLLVHLLETDFLGHPLRSLRLSSFDIRTIDLERLCGANEAPPINAPEVLTLESCTILPFRGRRVRYIKEYEMKKLACRFALRVHELSLLKIQAEISPNESWIPFFEVFRDECKALQSFRFEKVQNVFFDWDGNGQLDDGLMLPRIINEKGLNGALTKMIQCYHQARPESGEEK
ncbi:hypothetical protein IWX47DRAFT_258728 [Phyllosticta citricarpa]